MQHLGAQRIRRGSALGVLLVTACTTSGPVSTGTQHAIASASHPASAALAPAGPAPGVPAGKEDEEQPAAAKLADSFNCVDIEGQQHVPGVNEQVSCRRGLDRAYVMTFKSAATRDVYLAKGPAVVPGGWYVVGPSWVVHVENAAVASAVQRELHGGVRPAA